MKYATFAEFVKDAYYHGVDLMTLEIDFKKEVYDNGNGIAPSIWRNTLHTQIMVKDFAAAEKWLDMACNWIRVPGVITYVPTDKDVKQCYISCNKEAIC